MLNRRSALIGASAGLAMLGAPRSLRAQGAIEKKQVVLGIGSAAQQVVNLPINVAIKKNYFVDEGLDPVVVELGSGTKGVQALVGGSADMIAGAYEHVIRMHAQGIDLKCVAVFNKATSVALGITKKFEPKYKTFADLKGAKIGITAPGSASHYFLSLLLARNGMKASDVSIVGVGGSFGAIAAVRQGGEIDAIVNYDPLISELAKSGDIKVIFDSRTIEGTKALYGHEYMFVSEYTTADFIKSSPNTVQAVVNALGRAIVWLRTASMDDIVASVPEAYTKADPELYKQTVINNFKGLSTDGRASLDAASAVYNNLREFDENLKSLSLDLATTYDNRFIEVALKKYHG
jgi:NitT/TauT family transport system substrate-binding protein